MKASPYAVCSAGVSFKRCCSFSSSSLRSIWLLRPTTAMAARRSSGSSISSGTCNHGAAGRPQGPAAKCGCSMNIDCRGGWQRCVHYDWLHAGLAGHVRVLYNGTQPGFQFPIHLGGQASALLQRQCVRIVSTPFWIPSLGQLFVQSWQPLCKSSKHSLFEDAVAA